MDTTAEQRKNTWKVRSIAWTAGILSVFIVSGGFFLFFNRDEAPRSGRPVSEGMIRTSRSVANAAANLYFSDRDNAYLIAETRSLPRPDAPEAFGKVILQALVKGPGDELARTIPAGTRVRAFYIAEGGTAVVDLSESVSENHPGGCKTELLTLYSMVNSLVLNIEEIDSVKILVGGREADTLSGHVDLRFPFKANMLLIR